MDESRDVPIFSTPSSSAETVDSDDGLTTHELNENNQSTMPSFIYHLVFNIPENDRAFPEMSDHQSVLTDLTRLVPE